MTDCPKAQPALEVAPLVRALDRGTSRPLTVLALVYLVILAGLIPTAQTPPMAVDAWSVLVYGLLGIYGLFLGEFLLRQAVIEQGRCSWRRLGYGLLAAIWPPLRIGVSPMTLRDRLWLPFLGWRRIDETLGERLERHFSLPMMLIAMLILPVLGLEMLWQDQVEQRPWLASSLDVSTRLIWLAFALEFAVMLSATREKLSYCIQHWVDLVIIILPLVSFLRALRVLRLGRMVRAGRMARLARTYRLRGVVLRLFRAAMLLHVLERYSTWFAERRIRSLRRKIDDKHKEIQDLEKQVDELNAHVERRRNQRVSASAS